MLASYYKRIADLINNSQSRGSDIDELFDRMIDNLSNSEINEDDIYRERLENQIITTRNDIYGQNSEYTYQLLLFVKQLQQYITTRYSSVDSFLELNNIQVLTIFADISSLVGFPISSDNIYRGSSSIS